MSEVQAVFKLESECVIKDREGNIKSCLYEINDTLCGFPVLGILEFDHRNQVIWQEIRVEMDDGRILTYDLRR